MPSLAQGSIAFPPWRHDSELAMVRDWFFPDRAQLHVFSSPQQDMRQRAIDRVNLWLFRAGQLPSALVATAGLTEAVLHGEAEKTGGKISDSAMQSIYAMAFARFVNTFVDRDVAHLHAAELALDDVDRDEGTAPTSKGESSMYAHAAAIGMPQKFVHLRHQVAHGDIPNLIYLRQMALQGLAWLWERWWVKHATGNPERALRELEARKRIAQEVRDHGSGVIQDRSAQ
jgi:ribosomal biogenesis protein LAS1